MQDPHSLNRLAQGQAWFHAARVTVRKQLLKGFIPLAGKGQDIVLRSLTHLNVNSRKCKDMKLPEVRQEINLVNFGYGKAFFFQINVLKFF